MIYTLTMNPSIDYHMELASGELNKGMINRSKREEIFPGGKGLNVSVVLGELLQESRAFAFAAGKTGRMLEELAGEHGCSCDFIYLSEGESRINVKLEGNEETAVNGRGPGIDEDALSKLYSKLESLSGEDYFVLSGNARAENGRLYSILCEKCRKKEGGALMVLDTEGEALSNTFSYSPFLIKPNEEELLSLFNCRDESEEGLIKCMEKCREEGVLNILLTRGEKGALLLAQNGEIYKAELIKKRKVVSTVGAGDSTLAGFLAGLNEYGGDLEKSLRLACAAGCAASYTRWLPEAGDIRDCLSDIEVYKL